MKLKKWWKKEIFFLDAHRQRKKKIFLSCKQEKEMTAWKESKCREPKPL